MQEGFMLIGYVCFAIALCIYPTIRLLDLWHLQRPPIPPQVIIVTIFQCLVLPYTCGRFIVTIGKPVFLILPLLINMLWLLQRVLGQQLDHHLRTAVDDTEIARLKLLVEAEPENAAYHSVLGEAYLRCERYQQAKEELIRAIELLPEDFSRSERHQLKQVEGYLQQHSRG